MCTNFGWPIYLNISFISKTPQILTLFNSVYQEVYGFVAKTNHIKRHLIKLSHYLFKMFIDDTCLQSLAVVFHVNQASCVAISQ